MANEITQKDREIAALRDALAEQNVTLQKQEGRMSRMKMALAEVLRKQPGEEQLGWNQ